MSLPTPYYSQRNITIYHGDVKDILPRITQVDMIFTDPPYGHNNNNGDLIHNIEVALGKSKVKKDPRPIFNDGEKEASDLVQFLFQESKRLLVPGGCLCCCCGGGGPDPQFARWTLWLDQCLNFKQMVVWDKGPMGMGWHYRRSYETVLVAQQPGSKCRWFDTSKKVENIIRHIRKIIPRKTDHPTPKPVALVKHFLGLHSQEGDLVLDPFMGGGSTALAALEMNRKFIGVELTEQWCQLTVQRLEQKMKELSHHNV